MPFVDSVLPTHRISALRKHEQDRNEPNEIRYMFNTEYFDVRSLDYWLESISLGSIFSSALYEHEY